MTATTTTPVAQKLTGIPNLVVKPPSEIFNSEQPYSIRAVSLDKMIDKIETQQSGYQELISLMFMSHHCFLPPTPAPITPSTTSTTVAASASSSTIITTTSTSTSSKSEEEEGVDGGATAQVAPASGPIQLLNKWIDRYNKCKLGVKPSVQRREWILNILMIWLQQYSTDWFLQSDLLQQCLQFVDQEISNENSILQSRGVNTILAGNSSTTTTTANSSEAVKLEQTNAHNKSFDEYYISQFVTHIISRLQELYNDQQQLNNNNTESSSSESSSSSSSSTGDSTSNSSNQTHSSSSSSTSTTTATTNEEEQLIKEKLEKMKQKLIHIQQQTMETYSPTYALSMDWDQLATENSDSEVANDDDEEATDEDDEDEEDEDDEEEPFNYSITKFHLKQIEESSEKDIEQAVTSGNGERFDWSLHLSEFAIQLTLMDYKLFCSIENSECVSRDYHDANDLKQFSPNISLMIDHFDMTNRWAVSQILSEETPEGRAKVITGLIELMRQLYTLDSYHSLMAVFSSLSSQAVFRLKRTKALLSCRDVAFLGILDTLLNPSKRFKALTQECRNCQAPCLPYIGVFLSQLSAVQTGYDNWMKVQGGIKLIHINKFRLYSKIMAEMHTFQKYARRYRTLFREVPVIQSFITSEIYHCQSFKSPDISQQFLEKSRTIEPR